MNRFIRYLFFGLSVVILQTSLVPSLDIFGQRPDLVVIFALIVGAYESTKWGCIAGFLVGLAVDLYHPPTMGAGAMAGTFVGYFGGRAQEFLDFDVPINQGAAFAAGLIAHDIVYSVVASIQLNGSVFLLFVSRAFGGAIYTMIIGTACLATIGLVRRSKGIVARR